MYKNSSTKVKIICPIHGVFEQIAMDHMRGRGCAACGKEECKRPCNTTEFFITRAEKLHHNKFDYSLVNYIGTHSKVKIICPIHGTFEQIAMDHLKGIGCRECGIAIRAKNNRLPFQKFVERAHRVHGAIYDYSQVVYHRGNRKVKIICPKHGIFEQRPVNHCYGGDGCPKCNVSLGEKAIQLFLLANNHSFECQKTFPTCRNPKTNRPLRFDFYLPNCNLLIEYDGEQHFGLVPFVKDVDRMMENLQAVQYRDSIKTLYAKNNNIPLLRISYKEKKKIASILEEWLCDFEIQNSCL